jgi:hypothetical protein
MVLINLPESFKKNIFSGIQDLKIPVLFLSVIAFNLAAAFLFLLFRNDFFYTIMAYFFPFDSLYEELFVVAVIAPLFETTMYQYGVMSIILILSKRVFKQELIIPAILISILTYSWSHFDDYVYMIQMMISGLSYCIFYLILEKRNKNAFMYTLAVHMICNFLVFCLKHIY